MSVATNHKNLPSFYCTGYQRQACKVGIVHLGYGAFHRAHQAVYIDDYMEQTGDLNWGIAAVNLRSEETQSFNQASKTDDGYILKTTDANGEVSYRKVRSHLEHLDWSVTPEKAENLLSSEHTHVVTITVSESGYYLDSDGNLDVTAGIISGEIEGGEARSVYGYLANALDQRMKNLDQPLSVLCCDNIRANGKMLRKNLIAYLSAKNQNDLVHWVEQKVSFPCSVVDRITPRASQDLVSEISNNFGFTAIDPINAEDFIQWVIEDKFASTFPNLKKSGVEIVAEVDPYEETKIRILNGGHTALAYLGALAGYETFDQAMLDSELRAHFDSFQNLEVLPGLEIELPFSRQEYLQKVSQRFCNSAIADQLERICMDGYSKMQLYVAPTLEACLKQNIMPNHAIDSIASWYVYARRFKTGDTSVRYIEPNWEALSVLLEPGKEMAFASDEQLWGTLPTHYNIFASTLVEAIEEMEQRWPA